MSPLLSCAMPPAEGGTDWHEKPSPFKTVSLQQSLGALPDKHRCGHDSTGNVLAWRRSRLHSELSPFLGQITTTVHGVLVLAMVLQQEVALDLELQRVCSPLLDGAQRRTGPWAHREVPGCALTPAWKAAGYTGPCPTSPAPLFQLLHL